MKNRCYNNRCIRNRNNFCHDFCQGAYTCGDYIPEKPEKIKPEKQIIKTNDKNDKNDKNFVESITDLDLA